MAYTEWIIYTLFVALISPHEGGAAVPGYVSHERRLYTNLTSENRGARYAPRPVRANNDTVDVRILFRLMSIEEVNLEKNYIKTHGILYQKWLDPSLTWSPADYGNIKKINIPYYRIWRPDILLFNNADSYFHYKSTTNVVVNSTGGVFFFPPVQVVSSCSFDMSRFPYDQHVCNIRFGSWTWDAKKVRLVAWRSGPVAGVLLSKVGNWDLTAATSKVNDFFYGEDKFQDFTVTVSLKRKSGYAVHLFFAPSVAMALVTPTVFLMPTESKLKSTLGIGVLISQVMLLSMLEGMLPTTSMAIPLIGKHMICNIILMALCLVVTSLINSLWYRSYGNVAMNSCIRMVFLSVLGRIVCVTNSDPVFIPSDCIDQEDSIDGAKAPPGDNIVSREWRQLSVVFDRLCFVLYLVAVLILMFAAYH